MKGARNICFEYKKLRIDEKVMYFNQDFASNDQLSRMDKSTLGIETKGYVDLHSVYQNLSTQLESVQKEINSMKGKTWLMETSENLKSDSEALL
jgi:hypothetical protein